MDFANSRSVDKRPCGAISFALAFLMVLAAPARSQETKRSTPAERFAARADILLGANPVSKGEWGLFIVDAASGEVLYEKNSASYFVPASNMKLLSTALALDKLGVNYRFRTTVETNGVLSPSGLLTGHLILVGRGDPNLSNRKFPFETREEFDGPPDKVLAELADQLIARGLKQISGDIVGDDSYFPRERYPDGWEIDDMVWEYGAAISAIVVDDNAENSIVIASGANAAACRRLTANSGQNSCAGR
jgi:D-alanyl-D-alanine carboxypeptidase/D-alanyl-D-alanine-endopeptidase (penicillin-binding protein 4)